MDVEAESWDGGGGGLRIDGLCVNAMPFLLLRWSVPSSTGCAVIFGEVGDAMVMVSSRWLRGVDALK